MRKGRRGRTLCPFLQRAGISARGCSLPLQRRIADFGSERSERDSIQGLKEHYGIEVPLYAVDKVTRNIAREVADYNLSLPEGEVKAKTQVVELDGSMVPIVEFLDENAVSTPEAKADKRKRRQCQWNEIRLCTAHDIERAEARYGASFGGVLEAGCMMQLTARQHGMNHQTHIHGIGDGAPWIADQFDRQFGTQSEFLIDFYHLCEYLAEAATACTTSEGKEFWIELQKERFKRNEYQDVMNDLRPHLDDDEIAEESAPVRRCLRYLTNRQQHLNYKDAKARSLPIGSGEVESAHRHVLQKRLKLSGAWWLRQTAENMAQLRVNRANGDWDGFWEQKAA